MQNLSILTQNFSEKYHSAHQFSFKSCLANLLGNKITNFYRKHWFLIFKDVKGDENSQFSFCFFFYFNKSYPKIFLCFLAVILGVNNFHEKKPWDVIAFLRTTARKLPWNAKKAVSGSLSSMQQHLLIYFSANFARKCCILAHN